MVTLVYHHHMIRSSELMCYVDDKLALQTDCSVTHTSDVSDIIKHASVYQYFPVKLLNDCFVLYIKNVTCLTQVFDKCFLGSSPSGTIDSVFQGQIATVYFFKEPQSPTVVSCLYKLGPRYCVSCLSMLLSVVILMIKYTLH